MNYSITYINHLINLLDKTILHPNMASFNDRLIPAGQERNIKLGISYQF